MKKLLYVLLLAAIPCNSVNADIITFVDNQVGWGSLVGEVAADSPGGHFGANPAVANNVGFITRNGTGTMGTAFSYTVQNRDTLAEINNTSLLIGAGGLIADLYHDTNATLDVEDPVNQDGSLGNNNWGVDSSGTGNNNSVGGIASRNAAVFTFGSGITAFNIDLLDFESRVGQEGLLVLGLGGNIVHTEDIAFGGAFGNGETHNFGIVASNGMEFDTAIFILGDDNDSDTSNGYGGSEFWAIGNATIGVAVSVPEPASGLVVGMLGIACLIRRRKK